MKFCPMIGYPSGQDGAILPTRTTRRLPQEKFPRKSYNNHFLRVYGHRLRLGPKTHKKELG